MLAGLPLAAQTNVKSPADAVPAALRDVRLSAGANGGLRCQHANGQACTDPEVQALSNVVKSKSNITNNRVSGQGDLNCQTASGQACGTDEVQAILANWNQKRMQTDGGEGPRGSGSPGPVGKAAAPAPKAEKK
jgi:cobalamin biosynthesis Mg chelatase CobN